MDKKHWYELAPKPVKTSLRDEVNILWNQQAKTDRIIPNNKADIVIRKNENEICMLIDIAMSRDINMIKKGNKRVLNYEDLSMEV